MKYISLLRGINVGGKHIVKMKDLKNLYINLGFENIVTYIQSGNVIFETDNTNANTLILNIEKHIEEQYQFKVPVQLRTNVQFKKIIENCPLEEFNVEENGSKLSVVFLSSNPSVENVKKVMEFVVDPEELFVKGRELYLYCPGGFHKTKLNNSLLERNLNVRTTARNWKTVCKLYELSKD